MRKKDKKELVEKILKQKPKTRDSDTELLIQFFIRTGHYLTPELREAMHKIGSFESITRYRREIQAEGKYQSTLTVAQRRAKLAKETRATRSKKCAD